MKVQLFNLTHFTHLLTKEAVNALYLSLVLFLTAKATYNGKLIHLQCQLVKLIFAEFAVEQLLGNTQTHAVMPHHYLPSAFFHSNGVDLQHLSVSLHVWILVQSSMNHSTCIGKVQLNQNVQL
jgi:hypothetical protein